MGDANWKKKKEKRYSLTRLHIESQREEVSTYSTLHWGNHTHYWEWGEESEQIESKWRENWEKPALAAMAASTALPPIWRICRNLITSFHSAHSLIIIASSRPFNSFPLPNHPSHHLDANLRGEGVLRRNDPLRRHGHRSTSVLPLFLHRNLGWCQRNSEIWDIFELEKLKSNKPMEVKIKRK